MATTSIHADVATTRVRAAVGVAGMFVVGCFGLALFFTGEQSHAADQFAHSEENAAFVQVAEAR